MSQLRLTVNLLQSICSMLKEKKTFSLCVSLWLFVSVVTLCDIWEILVWVLFPRCGTKFDKEPDKIKHQSLVKTIWKLDFSLYMNIYTLYSMYAYLHVRKQEKKGKKGIMVKNNTGES